MSTILVVDDDPDIADVIAAVLTDAGYRVAVATGWRALRYAEEAQPALILLDIRMPLLGGAAMLTYLHNAPETAHIPVVVLTGVEHVEEGVQRMGACAYLAKPFDVRALLRVVARCLGEGGTS